MTIPIDTAGVPQGQPDPLIGSPVYGGYRIVKRLGAGAMGAVYLATDEEMRIAVKVLLPEYSQHGEVVARFYREGKAASVTGHPNIVKVEARGTLGDGRAFVAMEYLDGVTLEQYLESWRVLAIEDALAILVQIASALDTVHRAGIVHRDIKPANLFVTRLGRLDKWIKVLDFGVAKFREGIDGMRTRPGAIIGTPFYMSPEQAMGGHVDHRSDLYALAMIAHQMVTGVPPQRRDGSVEWIDPRELMPSIPEAWATAILWGLAFHPDERPRTLLEWARALVDATAGGRAIAEQYAPGFYESPDPEAPTRKHTEPNRPSPVASAGPTTLGGAAGALTSPMRTSRAPWLVAVSALAIALIAVALLLITRRARVDATGAGVTTPSVDASLAADAHHVSPSGASSANTIGVDGAQAPPDAAAAPDAAPSPDAAPPPDASPRRRSRHRHSERADERLEPPSDLRRDDRLPDENDILD